MMVDFVNILFDVIEKVHACTKEPRVQARLTLDSKMSNLPAFPGNQSSDLKSHWWALFGIPIESNQSDNS